jgi:hypothetical protein
MVLPAGFVDTSRHLWNSFMRGLLGDGRGHDSFMVKRGLTPFYRPVDFYCTLSSLPQNGGTVIADGRVVKRSGELMDVGSQRIVTEKLNR